MKAKVDLALRSTVFPQGLIDQIVPQLDGSFSTVWFPSVSPLFDPLETCDRSLRATGTLKAGTGVIRLSEFDLAALARRTGALYRNSGGRFILGVGTGRLRGREALDRLVGLTNRLRTEYMQDLHVPTYFAALGPKMVRSAFAHADGVLLNFCSPGYANRVTSGETPKRDGFKVACYVKLFFAEDEAGARRILADEFTNYDSLPQYHSMFEAMGIAKALEALRAKRDILESDIGGEISQISIANPSREQVLSLLGRFRKAGVDSPVVYPYVAGTDDYKLEVVRRLREWLA